MVRPAARPDQRIEEVGPLELLGALHPDRLVDDLGAGAGPLVGLVDFAVDSGETALFMFDDLLAVDHSVLRLVRFSSKERSRPARLLHMFSWRIVAQAFVAVVNL